MTFTKWLILSIPTCFKIYLIFLGVRVFVSKLIDLMFQNKKLFPLVNLLLLLIYLDLWQKLVIASKPGPFHSGMY